MHRSCADLRLNVYTVQDGVIFQCLAVRMLRARECVNRNAALTSKHEQGNGTQSKRSPTLVYVTLRGAQARVKRAKI